MKKWIVLSLKIALVLLLVVVLYVQLTQNQQLSLPQLAQAFVLRWSWTFLWWLLPVLLLMPFNWGFETRKWQIAMHPIEPIPFRQALRAVLAGVTFSLFTPNRIGEYGGRVLLVKKGQGAGAVLATIVGSMAQWWVLWTSGLFAFLFFYYHAAPVSFSGKWVTVLTLVGIGISAVLLFAYFRIHRVLYWLGNRRWTSRWALRLWDKLARHYTRRELLQIIFFSTARYLVYSFQFYLLLHFWGCPLPFLQGMAAIAFIFLLQTGIPIPPATGLVIRGNIALWVFTQWGTPPDLSLPIVAATWSLWLINVVLPALMGSWVLLRLRS